MSGWGFGNIWGGGGGGGNGTRKKDSIKNSILGMRSTLDMLSKREKHLQNQMNEQDTIARNNVTTNKTAAKAALRRKKAFEQELERTSASIMTVEREISSIETANINKETLAAIQSASKAMKEIHGGTTVEKVDQILEDLREQHAVSDEIADAITQGATPNAIDDEELEAELADLQQAEFDDKMLKTGTGPVADHIHRLPNQPIGPIKGKQIAEEDDEEAELQRLQAEMAM